MKNLAEKIKALRVEKRFSQEEIADKIQLNQSSYYKVESGKTEISVQRLYNIAEALGVTIFELLGNETAPNEQVKGLESRILELESRIRDKDKIITNLEEYVNDKDNKRAIFLFQKMKKLEENLSKISPITIIGDKVTTIGNEWLKYFKESE